MKYILILEDDGDLAAGMEMALMGDDFVFTVCGSIKEAEERLRQQAFDLLILDVNLPDGSGFELCRKIRKNSKVSIILLTARDMELDIVRGLECGADDYITKPFGTSELMARIRTALRRSTLNGTLAAPARNRYEAKDLVIDYDRHIVTVNGAIVHFTQIEYKILTFLARNAGKVITYDTLITHVWGPFADSNNRILRVNMANIRRKMELNPADPQYIFTEIGIGYRMIDNENM